MENLEPPSPSKSRMGKWRVLALRAASSLIWGDGGLLFHFILSQIAIVDKINGKTRPPLPPNSRMEKWRLFALRAASSLTWGGRGFAVPFYFVQDCRSSWYWIRAYALRHSGAMTHVLYYKFKTARKTAQICDQPKECEESGRKIWNSRSIWRKRNMKE